MDRVELKKILREMGVSETLTEMPAVVEPIFREVFDQTSNEVRECGRFVVYEDGSFSFDERQITLSPGSGATISYEDVLIEVNTYGMEIEYSDGNYQNNFSSISRKDGRVDTFSGSNGSASGVGHMSLDNGSWSIKDSRGADIVCDEYHNDKMDEEIDSYDLNLVEILNEFDERATGIILAYPNTEGWYRRTRMAVVENIEKQNDPEEKEIRRIQRLERRVIKLEIENKKLQETNTKTANLLERALKFVKEVKKSPAGQIFFGRKLKALDIDTKRLSSGN
jgi:hypothetical protein